MPFGKAPLGGVGTTPAVGTEMEPLLLSLPIDTLRRCRLPRPALTKLPIGPWATPREVVPADSPTGIFTL